ncbi:MAG: 4'-phosphopantetheinyl transferase superfamily protein, partial [Bacteroidota bacterium]
MPLILQEKIVFQTFHGKFGLWQITEEEDVLRTGLALHQEEQAQLENIKGEGRRKEFLAARQLLHRMSGRSDRGPLLKDEFGKPHMYASPWHVSISHTTGLSAAVAHPRPCGIDVQIFVPKISRIAPRFMSDAEASHLTDENRLLFQHLVWSAKEVMYKAYGRREIDFREHLHVELGGLALDKGRTWGTLKKDDW